MSPVSGPASPPRTVPLAEAADAVAAVATDAGADAAAASVDASFVTSIDCQRASPCAAPKPRCGTCTTRAPCATAMAAESSVEPLSATMGRNPFGTRDSTQGRAPASLRHGRTTSISMATDSTSGAFPMSAKKG